MIKTQRNMILVRKIMQKNIYIAYIHLYSIQEWTKEIPEQWLPLDD
jgi:hypothetical protein